MPVSSSYKKTFVFLTGVVVTTTILLLVTSNNNNTIYKFLNKNHQDNWKKTTRNKVRMACKKNFFKFLFSPQVLSKLGRILFLNEKPPKPKNANFTILLWKYGRLKAFFNNSFEKCSVKNCKITYNKKDINQADLLIFPLHKIKSVKELPSGPRNPKQIWAFLTNESPYNTFFYQRLKLKYFDGVFNWSMTYRYVSNTTDANVSKQFFRMDSDIPVPYGRTIVRTQPKSAPNRPWTQKRRDVLATIIETNCDNHNKRWEYVQELQKHLQVDFYGKCGALNCPKNCPAISNYLFYFAFESSNCDGYITDGVWGNAYAKHSIPILMGASRGSYEKFLPPNSYIDVDNFARPVDVARYLLYLNKTNEYERFYKWKPYFDVLEEHGWLYYYCRACEALNYNEIGNKVYSNLAEFWSAERDCKPSWDAALNQ